jgi:pantoate--beta-alanine ligase
LLGARAAFAAGTRNAAALTAVARAEIAGTALTRIDYLSLVDAVTLQPVTLVERPAVLAAAVFYGEVRLIDHIGLDG